MGELNNGAYYSGYWEMHIHFRKALQPGQMPDPYVVKFWPETWIPNLTTGTSTRGKRWNNLLMTKLLHSSKMKHCHQPKQHPKQHQEQQLLPKIIRPSVVHSKSLFKGQKSKKRTPANWDSFFCYIFYFIIR